MLCPHCKVDSKVIDIVKLNPALTYNRLKCGHSVSRSLPSLNSPALDSPSRDGKFLYPFQRSAVEWARAGNVRVLIRAETGLGKTPIAIKTLESIGQSLPALILCRPRLKTQWLKEIYRWTGGKKVAIILNSPKDKFIHGFDYYIMSQELVKKLDEAEIAAWPINTVVIDECQHIKNLESQRTQSIRKLVKVKPNVIALSATPIKNRFDEYYPVCHMLDPDKFGSYNTFVETWCEFVYKGSYAKVRGCKFPTEWAEFTKNCILHIKKEDVLPDLPRIRRDFRYYDLADEVKQAYQDKVEEFEEYFEGTTDTGFALAQNLLAYFAAMRQLTAISKVSAAKEFVEDFLLSTERKIVVFVHHHLAADMLIAGLNEVLRDGGYSPCLYFKGGLTDKEADRIKAEFLSSPNRRVLIASTLAAGEGLDGLQNVCSDLVMMERQWNPANEEQVEGRLERIGQASSIQASYLIALGTIDEWLTDLVESKREMLKTAEGKEAEYSQNSVMMELAEMIMSKRGGKKWS